MPYYKWKGVDILGNIKRGKLFSLSDNDLDEYLFRRGIALLSHSSVRSLFKKPITQKNKIEFFQQLSSLLHAGILLPESLTIIWQQLAHPQFQEVICDVAQLVKQGTSFSSALEKHSHCFDTLMVNIIHAGQESGMLAQASTFLYTYLEFKNAFKKKLWSAALIPVLTIIFFGIISSVIFIFIIPRFSIIFQSMDKDLPAITQWMVRISNFLMSMQGLMALGFTVFSFLFFWIWKKTKVGKQKWDNILLKMPFIKELLKSSSLVSFLQSLSILVRSGVPLTQSVELSQKVINNLYLVDQIDDMIEDIKAGNSLSESMQADQSGFCDQQTINLVVIGQESGNLSDMLERASMLKLQELEHQLSIIVYLFQPIILIIIGLLITLLIFSVYMPIINLSDII